MERSATYPRSAKQGELNFRLNSDDWSQEEIKQFRKHLKDTGKEFKSYYTQHKTKCIGNYTFRITGYSFLTFAEMMELSEGIILRYKQFKTPQNNEAN